MITMYEIIRQLEGKSVLDIGGVGYVGALPIRDRLMLNEWERTQRTVLDIDAGADIVADLDCELPHCDWSQYDITTCFGTLEHLKNPAHVLEWIGTPEVWITLPTATSIIHELAEEELFAKMPEWVEHGHMYSFVPRTARALLRKCGWCPTETAYNYDYQSWRGHLAFYVFSICPLLFSHQFLVKAVRDDESAA